MDEIFEKVQAVVDRYDEISELISDPEVIADTQRFMALSKEEGSLRETVDVFKHYRDVVNGIADNEEMLNEGLGDDELEELAKEDYNLAIHYSGNKDKADKLAASISSESIVVQGDVADEVEMAKVFNQVEEAFGKIDVVINTAGIMLLSPIIDMNLDDLDRMHRINIRGTFVVSQLAAQRLENNGAIVNFSTSVTRTQFPSYGGYVASKAAVESITLILARELRGRGIRVNAVAPGPTATDLFLKGKSEEQIQGLKSASPLERLGKPEDIARTTAFLVKEDNWVNGQVVFSNGGLA